MDSFTPQQRHDIMAAIHSEDTKPEMIVRKFLWQNGFRYRLHAKNLPGKPDLILKMYRTCIFVNGCFWHGHTITVGNEEVPCPSFKMPKTNTEFWENKIRRNKERDARVKRQLAEMGWNSITVWECSLKPSKREQTLRTLVYMLDNTFLKYKSLKAYSTPEENDFPIAAEKPPKYSSDTFKKPD